MLLLLLLPMLQALSCDPYGVMGLILSPARELASQIADQVSALGSGMGVQVVTIVGGHDMMQQALVLDRNRKSHHLLLDSLHVRSPQAVPGSGSAASPQPTKH